MNKIFMRNLFPALVFTLSLTALTVTAQRFLDPISYMDYIGENYEVITKDLWDYMKAASHSKNARKIESKRRELVKSTYLAQKRIARLPDYEGDGSYRDSVISYLELSYHLLKEDYAKIVDLEEIAEQSYDLMEAYLTAKKKANEKLDYAAEMMQNEQQAFADLYGIQLIEKEDKISKRLKIAIEVYDYYNTVYLIFFKSYKQEAYLLEAISNRDFSAMEQNRKTLLEFSGEGQYRLDTIMGFKDDHALSTSCRKMLVFYNDEASKDMNIISEFFLKQEKLEKIKNYIEKKSASQRTKEEIDEYNNLIEEYNQMINDYNITNEALNKERGKLIEEWNKVSNKFINKHVP